MDYKVYGEKIFIRLDPKDEVLASLAAVCEKENVRLGAISGLGAVNEMTVGVFDTEEKKFYGNDFTGKYEIVSLVGSVTEMDGKAYLHCHMAAGDETGRVVGGHLSRAVVSATAEIVMDVAKGRLPRTFSDEIGLNLFDFGKE